jgi:hypothetical protein
VKPPRSITRLFPNVNKLQEARKPVAVEVTAKDVSRGKIKKHRECAMANAVCREWGADHAVIGMTYSYVIKGNTAVKFKTPDTVSREIVSFDRNKTFEPGAYHLGPVSPGLTAAAQKKAYKKQSGGEKVGPRKRSKRRVFHKSSFGVRARTAA